MELRSRGRCARERPVHGLDHQDHTSRRSCRHLRRPLVPIARAMTFVAVPNDRREQTTIASSPARRRYPRRCRRSGAVRRSPHRDPCVASGTMTMLASSSWSCRRLGNSCRQCPAASKSRSTTSVAAHRSPIMDEIVDQRKTNLIELQLVSAIRVSGLPKSGNFRLLAPESLTLRCQARQDIDSRKIRV